MSSGNAFFAGFELGCQQPPRRAGQPAAPTTGPAFAADRLKQARVDALVGAYRRLGHQAAKVDPLNLRKRIVPELSLDYMDLTEADLDSEFDFILGGQRSSMKLRAIVALMQETYVANVGIEYMHIEDFTIRRWLRDRIEAGHLRKDNLPLAEKKRVLTHLLEGELFEKFSPYPLCGAEAFFT